MLIRLFDYNNSRIITLEGFRYISVAIIIIIIIVASQT